MTPMMCPPGAAAAASGGLVNSGEILPGAPNGAPGGLPVAPEDAGLAAFNVALLAVLDQAAAMEADAQPLPGQTGSGDTVMSQTPGTEPTVAALWSQPSGPGRSAGGQVAGDAPDEAATVLGDAEDAKVDDDAAVVSALALATCPVAQRVPVPRGGVALPGGEATTGASASEATDAEVLGTDADRGTRTTAPLTDVAAARPRNDGVDGGVDGPPAGQVADHVDDGAPKDGPSHSANVTQDIQPAERVQPARDAQAAAEPASAPERTVREVHGVRSRAAVQLNAVTRPVETRQAAEVLVAAMAAASTNVAGSAAASASSESSTRTSSTSTVVGTDEQPVQRSSGNGLAPSASLALADQQTASSADERSRDRSRDERRTSVDLSWLRRSSSIEARLTPPPSFAPPTVTLATVAATPAGVTAGSAQIAFEMPVPPENLARLVQSIRMQARDGVSQASLRLNPEHLGEVTIAIRVESGTVTALVRAEAGDVRQWLRGQEDNIRAALAEQGLTLDELVVEQDSQRRQGREPEPDQQPRRHRARGGQVSPPSFEVTA